MKNRNIALCIVFTIISCGIYGFYWMFRLATESYEMLQSEGMSPVAVVLIGLVTGGIYWWIWMFQIGKKLDEKNGSSNAVLYLLLAIFGLVIVDMALLQNEINKNVPA